ncbi:hypothetical protein [Piscinibacter sakaiensis]|uniref:hypothetical protein n=1 Tax=Piscinibacter sakaiensis TaxID=1547922 RepID=UPI003AAFAA5F
MRIKYELLAAVALLGVTAALLRPAVTPLNTAGARADHPALEADAPRHADGIKGAAAQERARQRLQAIDAARMRQVASGALTAREVTPAELRLIRNGAVFTEATL